MFEGIQHSFNDDTMTVARYVSGDVHGSVCFSSDHKATRVRSSIGPVGATRECLASHWCGFRNRYKARIEDEVQCYAYRIPHRQIGGATQPTQERKLGPFRFAAWA